MAWAAAFMFLGMLLQLVAANGNAGPPPLRWHNELAGRVGQNVLGYTIEEGDMVVGYRYGSKDEADFHRGNNNVLRMRSMMTSAWIHWNVNVKNYLGGQGIYLVTHWSMKDPAKAPNREWYNRVCVVIGKTDYVESLEKVALGDGELMTSFPDDSIEQFMLQTASKPKEAVKFAYDESAVDPRFNEEQTSRSIQLQLQTRTVEERRLRVVCAPLTAIRNADGSRGAIDLGPAPWFTEEYKLKMKGALAGRLPSPRRGRSNRRRDPVGKNEKGEDYDRPYEGLWEPQEVPKSWFPANARVKGRWRVDIYDYQEA